MKNLSPLTSIYSIRWHLFWAIGSALIATSHWSGIYYQYDSIKWWLLDILLALYTAIKIINCQRIDLSKFAIVVLVFIAWGLTSTLWASHRYTSIEMGFRYLLIATSLYFLSRDLNQNTAASFLLTIAISSCATFFLVLIIERYALKLPYERPNYTPLGFINHAGHVYLFWIPVLFWGVFKLPRFGAASCAILLAATLTLLADSAIRASIVGLSVACCILAAIFLKINRRAAVRFMGILGLLTLAIIAVGMSQKNDSAIMAKLTRIAEAPDLNYASSDRIVMYKNTLTMIKDNPFGVGLNNFEYIHPLYGQAGTPNASPFMNETQILKQPHNFYLKAASEIGWFGTAGLLAIILGLLLPFTRVNILENEWAHPCLLSLLATFFNALFCAVFSNPASLWFFLIITACSLTIVKPSSIHTTVEITQTGRILSLVLTFIFIGYSCANLMSQAITKDGSQTQNTLKLQRAVEIYPGNERAWFDLATTQFDQNGRAQEAITAMQHFLSLYPYHIGARYKIIQWYCFQRDFINCKAEALQLISYYPTFKPAQQFYLQASEALRKSQ